MNEVYAKLREWQPTVVEQTVRGLLTGNFLNASELGTGKSYMAVAAAVLMRMSILVVCRIGARTHWEEVAKHFGLAEGRLKTINRETLKRGKTPFGKWVRTGRYNHQTGRPELEFIWTLTSNTLLVVDEIHWDSGVNSQNSLMLRAAVKQGVKILGLSGTAAADPRKMRAIGYMLGLHKDVDFNQWLSKQGADLDSWDFGARPEFAGMDWSRKQLGAKRMKVMAEIHKELKNNNRMARLRRADIPGFPKCEVQVEAVDFNDRNIPLILSEMNEELKAWKERTGYVSAHPKAKEITVYALMKVELLMVPELVEEAQELLAEGQSVALFVSYTDTVQALAKRLGTDCIYAGFLTVEEREANRLKFQSTEPQERSAIIVVNSACGSESIGLQDMSEDGSFPRAGVVTPMFNAITLNQLLGRLPRDPAKSPSTYRLIYPANTILESAYRCTKAKAARYSAFNGDVKFEDADLLLGLHI